MRVRFFEADLFFDLFQVQTDDRELVIVFNSLILDRLLAGSPFPDVPDAVFDPLGDFGYIVDFLQFQIRSQLPFERMLLGCLFIEFRQHFLELLTLHAQQFFGSRSVVVNVLPVRDCARPVLEGSLIIFLALFGLFVFNQGKADRVAFSLLMQRDP